MIYNNFLDLIGNTPCVKLGDIYLKLEAYNASGSVKDRPAKYMIEGLEKEGLLKKGDVIVEPTSGNTGISLAMIGAMKGYRVILIMPDTMSVERRQVMKAYGAEIVLTDGTKGMAGALEEANRLVKEKGYIMPAQFDNKYNVLSHEETTAQEIIKDFKNLDYLVAGIGTGGTITGLSKILKSYYPNIKIVGVEPYESPMITQGYKGPHGIQGIGAGFIPSILNLDYVDEIITVKTEEARAEAKRLAKKGILLGISSGGAIKVAHDIVKKVEKDKIILVIAPDGGLKYLSMGVFD